MMALIKFQIQGDSRIFLHDEIILDFGNSMKSKKLDRKLCLVTITNSINMFDINSVEIFLLDEIILDL
jgi:hypothetical protein